MHGLPKSVCVVPVIPMSVEVLLTTSVVHPVDTFRSLDNLKR